MDEPLTRSIRPHRSLWNGSSQLGRRTVNSDVAGGRKWPKFEDRIVRREHSLKPPTAGQSLPILIDDNPSRDYFFPITIEQVREYLRTFPDEDVTGITHIWLRRIGTKAYRLAGRPLAEYISGSGVCAIIIYPWSKDRLLKFGNRRPSASTQKRYSRWSSDFVQDHGIWCLRWTDEALRDFYLTALLGHEVGHHRDRNRQSWANERRQEEAAEQYALRWMPDGEELFVAQGEV